MTPTRREGSSTIAPFSHNPDFDFDIRTALGSSVEGVGEPGEILAAVAGLSPSDHDGWFAAWRRLADRVSNEAESAATAGHVVTAAGAYLRASSYYAVAVNALGALDDDAQLAVMFAKQQSAWRGFLTHTAASVTELSIDYDGGTLPGWLFRPNDDGAPRATIVAVNGSDGAASGMWAACVAPALRRGYGVLVFDGPGQQSQIFDKGVPFRPDWENVLTPVYDLLAGLSIVDENRIAVYGISQGGYWVTRALAFEHRFVAAITDPGVVDVSRSWTDHIPHALLATLDAGKVESFDKEMAMGMALSPDTARTWRFRARPYGTSGYGETIEAVRQYNAVGVAPQITTPLLILSPEGEQFWPGQAERLAELTSQVSTLVRFTAAEGADGHCQPLARTLTGERMFDWLDERIAGRS